MKKLISLTGIIFMGTLAATPVFAKAVIIEAANLKFTDVPGFTGVHMAVAEGDPAKGAHHVFMKFDAGFTAPLHHHTADHFGTVISGTVTFVVDGKEHKLPPGSYFAFQNKGTHITKCELGSDCLIFLDTRGKWDVIAENKK